MKKRAISILALILVSFFLLADSALAVPADNTGDDAINRYNVVVVLDASGSMEDTDPEGLRYEAINQFMNLLTEDGNYLGCVVYASGISAAYDMVPLDSQQKRDDAIELLRTTEVVGWTNTGEALTDAVNMFDAADSTLPSVLLLLSDGNTEMGTDAETEESLVKKANAIQVAREKDIAIYSVCLNADQSADSSEMKQMSDATGGVFREISTADDLTDVFNTFYSMIYGTSSITVLDEDCPEYGIMESRFYVPGIGVEEINIVIYGNVTASTLIRPDGSPGEESSVKSEMFSLIKETDVQQGLWTLRIESSPGEHVKVNLLFNTNLSVELTADLNESEILSGVPVTLHATLWEGFESAQSASQYEGYEAVLYITNAYGDIIDALPMAVVGDHFELMHIFGEGVYYLYADVSGNNLEKVSNTFGPITSTPNTAPYPIESPLSYTVNLWPIIGGNLELDLTTLAEDAEEETLTYRISSSSFIEGEDYRVEDNVLTVDHFSLSRGGFTVIATDSGGLSCEIEMNITVRHIGRAALIIYALLALLIVIIVVVLVFVL